MQSYDVLIVGGGVVGLTAALAMAQKGYSVALLDAAGLQADLTKTDVRVYAINQASKQLLEQLQVGQALDKSRISPYQHMHVWDGVTGNAIDFDARLIANQQLGVILEEAVLKQALLQTIEKTGQITLIPHAKLDNLVQEPDKIVVFHGEAAVSARLLMVADGANSPTRKLLNVSLTSWSYQQQALVATVQVDKPHEQTAWQIFNPDGPLAFLPLVDEHQCSIVWSTTRAKLLHDLPEKEFNLAMSKALNYRLGAVSLQSERFIFPLTMRHANQYVGDRWLLLGDAAHTIHPLAGLGLNVGLADIKSWVDCCKLDSTKALGAYQRQRKHEVWKVIAAMEGLKRLFGTDLAPVVALRSLGLKLCNQLPLLKRFFIEQAN